MTRIKTVYRFVNVDEPTDFIETTVFSEGFDSQDKGSGKAMTYGDKYALMKAYKISTGDDPDATASEEVKYTTQERFSNLPAICPGCGKPVNPTKYKGKIMTPHEVLDTFGYCPSCYQKMEARKNVK